MAVVIEVAGISCSGKSTAMQYFKEKSYSNNTVESEAYLAEHYKGIANRLLLKDTVVLMPAFKFTIVAIEHLKNIANYRKFYSISIKKIMKNEGKTKAFRSFFFKIGKYYILKKANVPQIIMDEGPIQMLFALFVNRNAINDEQVYELKTFLKYMPMADKVIFGPPGPQELFVSRMVKRGHHRVTGSREIISDLNEVEFCELEVRKRALSFIAKSAQLQKLILKKVKMRTSILCISDINEWNKVFDEILLHKIDTVKKTVSFH